MRLEVDQIFFIGKYNKLLPPFESITPLVNTVYYL